MKRTRTRTPTRPNYTYYPPPLHRSFCFMRPHCYPIAKSSQITHKRTHTHFCTVTIKCGGNFDLICLSWNFAMIRRTCGLDPVHNPWGLRHVHESHQGCSRSFHSNTIRTTGSNSFCGQAKNRRHRRHRRRHVGLFVRVDVSDRVLCRRMCCCLYASLRLDCIVCMAVVFVKV